MSVSKTVTTRDGVSRVVPPGTDVTRLPGRVVRVRRVRGDRHKLVGS